MRINVYIELSRAYESLASLQETTQSDDNGFFFYNIDDFLKSNK